MHDNDPSAIAGYFTTETKWALNQSGLGDLVQALVATNGTSKSVVDAAIASLGDTRWVGALGLRWAAHCRDGKHIIPIFAGGLADGGADVVKTGLVFRNAKVAVALQAFDSLILRAVKASLDDAGMDILLGRSSVLKVVNQGTLVCQINEYEPLGLHHDFDQPLPFVSSREVQVNRCSPPLVIDGMRQGIRFTGSEDDPLLINVTSLAESLPFRTHISRSDGRVLALHANNDSDNSVRTMMTVLRQLGAEARRPILNRYLRHPTHFVRWHAMRELALLDPKEAAGRLRHPASEERSSYMSRNFEGLARHLDIAGQE